MAIAADTIIHTLSGAERASTLAASHQEFYCFTWDGLRITVGRTKLVPEPRRAPTVRLALDDNTVLRVTADQLAVLRDGGEASPFSSGLSLMPLYLGRTTAGYPTYKQTGELYKKAIAPCDRRRVRLVARMVYEWVAKTPIEAGRIVRYKNSDKTDCTPENLRIEGKPHPKRKPKHRLMKLARVAQMKTPNNHKVVGFEPFEEEDVFDFLDTGCGTIAAGGIFLVTNAPAS